VQYGVSGQSGRQQQVFNKRPLSGDHCQIGPHPAGLVDRSGYARSNVIVSGVLVDCVGMGQSPACVMPSPPAQCPSIAGIQSECA